MNMPEKSLKIAELVDFTLPSISKIPCFSCVL